MQEDYTIEQAAPICRTSTWTLYRRVKEGAIGSFRAGGGRNLRIPRDALIRFLLQHDIPLPSDLQPSARTRVLVVEDDERLCRALQRFFDGQEAYELRCVHSGLAAGLALRGFRPHVIVLDIMLGDVDGRDLLHHLRSDSELSGIKAIAMSGYLEDQDGPGVLGLGFADFLAKPFPLSELVASIERVLGRVAPAGR